MFRRKSAKLLRQVRFLLGPQKFMKVIYKNKKVKITKLVTSKFDVLKYPVLKQVRIEWKENGKTWTDYVDANQIKFK